MADKENWVVTDPDTVQCCRKASEYGPRVYELAEVDDFKNFSSGDKTCRVGHAHIYLDDYTDEEISGFLGSYGYGDMDGLKESYDNSPEVDYDQFIAEMAFETEIIEYDGEYCTFNQAVEEIEKITGMDLTQYKAPEKEKSSLSALISSAQDRAGEQIPNSKVLEKDR